MIRTSNGQHAGMYQAQMTRMSRLYVTATQVSSSHLLFFGLARGAKLGKAPIADESRVREGAHVGTACTNLDSNHLAATWRPGSEPRMITTPDAHQPCHPREIGSVQHSSSLHSAIPSLPDAISNLGNSSVARVLSDAWWGCMRRGAIV
jgi:hypothetical protein